MTVPGYSGCPWPIDTACDATEWATFSAEVQDRAVALASATLSRLTAYRVGNCPITVRPVPQRRGCSIYDPLGIWSGWLSYPYYPGVVYPGSSPINYAGYADGYTSVDTRTGIRLPGPVGRLDEVKVDGVALAVTDYHMEENILQWNGAGPNPFPATQDLTLPDTAVGTFSVTYLNCYPVDGMGAYACGVLALEFAKACTASKKCRLPSNVTNVVRQGISYTVVTGSFPNGFTSIHEVDTFIGLWNPKGLRQQSSIWSPEKNRPIHTTIGDFR